MEGGRRETPHPSESFRLASEPTIEEEERDEFNLEEQAPVFRTRQPSILHQRSSSFSGASIAGRARTGGIKASAPLDDNEDASGLSMSNGLERRASRRTSFNRKASGLTQPDAEQMILQQVLAKYSESNSSLDLKKESRKQIRQMLEEDKVQDEDKKKAESKTVESKSLVFQRKQVYTYLSLFYGSFLLVIVIYEMISLLTYETTPLTTRYLASFLVSIFVNEWK